ncbi:hypothetical protein ACOMHN_016146 [Nucella lapillus]
MGPPRLALADVNHALLTLGERQGSSIHALQQCLATQLPHNHLPTNFQLLHTLRRPSKRGITGPPQPFVPSYPAPQEKPKFKLDFQTLVERAARASQGHHRKPPPKKKRKARRGRRTKRGKSRRRKRKGKRKGKKERGPVEKDAVNVVIQGGR